MDTKKISLNGLNKVLTPQEMKNVKGGSGFIRCCCGMGLNINCFNVNTDCCDEAIWAVSWVCSDGGGCFC